MSDASHAADVLLGGGVIAYPTEGVFGLGCMPDNLDAVSRLLDLKRRDADKGLILIASRPEQFEGWITMPGGKSIPEPDPTYPITWIVLPGPEVDPLLRGEHEGIAVRLTTNPVAHEICETVNAPITSTSANLSGQPVAADHDELHRQFGACVDYIVPGDCGPASGPSEIRILETGKVLRPR